MTTSSAVGSCLSRAPFPSYARAKENVLWATTRLAPLSGGRIVKLRLNDPVTGETPSEYTQLKFGVHQGLRVTQKQWSVLKPMRSLEIKFFKALHAGYMDRAVASGRTDRFSLKDFSKAEGPLLSTMLAAVEDELSDEAKNFLITDDPSIDAKVNGVYPQINLTFLGLIKLTHRQLLSPDTLYRYAPKAIKLTEEMERNCELVMQELDMPGIKFDMPIDIVIGILDRVCTHGPAPDGSSEPFLTRISRGTTEGSAKDTWFIKEAAKELRQQMIKMHPAMNALFNASRATG